jgi:hypothetical protein
MVEGAERVEVGKRDAAVPLVERSNSSQPVKPAFVSRAGAR